MHKGSILKAGLFYLFGIIVLTYYGIEVCPYLDNLRPIELAGIFTPAFLIAGVCRMLILKWLDKKEQKAPEEVNLQKPWQQLRVDLGIWVFAGLLVTVWNFVSYDFPVESGLKVVLGCTTLGIFSAAYLALDTERDLILSTTEVYERVAPESRDRLTYIRDCELKGKSEACPVYGLTAA